ncbi:MAG: biotin--[acetyl-CoA-carboxylase] ligase [Lachnospiraceae bacterium]|nr:biotin--[acetyl-CoA-carboxylase] ligase [Lachnospiraceae bacterium]
MLRLNLDRMRNDLLKTKTFGRSCRYFEEIDSTNNYLKDYAREKGSNTPDGFLVVAGSQSAGRGRVGRKFFSPGEAGVYMSLFTRPNTSTENFVRITPSVAVAVCGAICSLAGKKAEAEGLTKPHIGIKWVNDIFLNGKKICGILTENVTDETGRMGIVTGIGINVGRLEFPEDLKNVATSLANEGYEINKEELIAEIMNRLEFYMDGLNTSAFLKEYKEKSLVLGKEIKVMAEDPYIATAMDIDENGGLIVKRGDEVLHINTGEVSIKL